MIKQFLATVTVGLGIALSIGNVYADGEEELTGAIISEFEAPSIPYQGSVTWTVGAYSVSGAEITYQWYYDDNGTFWDDEESRTPLVGETSNSIVINYGEDLHKAYYVIAYDGEAGNATGAFAIVDSGILAFFDSNKSDYDFFEQIGDESVTATIIAETPQDADLNYQWKIFNMETCVYEDIKGETTNSCTFTESGNYSCLITDGFGEKTLWFDVFKKTVFVDKVVGGTIISDDMDGCNAYVYLKNGEEKKITIKAHSSIDAELCYQWSELVPVVLEDGGYYYDLVPIGNNTPNFTVSDYKNYMCIVGGEGSSVGINITVVPENDIKIVQDTTEYSVEVGKKITLNFKVDNPDNAELIYVWSRQDNGETIKKTTSPKLTITTSVYTSQGIDCYVYVDKISENTLVGVASFSLGITGVVDGIYYGDGLIKKAGQTLTVDVETDYPELLEFQWYYSDEEDGIGDIYDIKGANSNKYTIPKNKSKIHRSYLCGIVLGGYSNNIIFVNKIHSFKDVLSGKFYSDAVAFVYARGIMKGYNEKEFGVNNNLKREQMITLLWQAQGEPECEVNKLPFKDVEKGKYYTTAVAWAKEQGITTGYSSGKFGTGDYITRQGFVIFLYRYAQLLNLDTGVENKEKYLEKADADQVSDFAGEAINWGYSNGFIGNNSDLKPKDNITRAEAALIIMRFFEFYGL